MLVRVTASAYPVLRLRAFANKAKVAAADARWDTGLRL